MNGFIIVATDQSNMRSFVSNSSPILWADDIKDAKIFTTFQNAKNELEDNFISLSATLAYTNISSIFICEYKNNVEIGRVKFI